jgi:hypothetical protein
MIRAVLIFGLLALSQLAAAADSQPAFNATAMQKGERRAGFGAAIGLTFCDV